VSWSATTSGGAVANATRPLTGGTGPDDGARRPRSVVVGRPLVALAFHPAPVAVLARGTSRAA